MLMKQQDRLEEREQDIEDQLYKLESDKRLVEVSTVLWLPEVLHKSIVEEGAILTVQSMNLSEFHVIQM